MVLAHLEALRAQFPSSKFHIFIEANMSFVESSKWQNVLAEHRQRVGWYELELFYADNTKVGVITTEQNKQYYVQHMSESLRHKRFGLSKSMVSERAEQVQAELRMQLASFEKKIKPGTSGQLRAVARYVFTGKGPGRKDDLVMALLMCLYWGSFYVA